MKDKILKRLGWVCLIYVGIYSFLIFLTIILPSFRKLHDIIWIQSTTSLGLSCWIGVLGCYLLREQEHKAKTLFATSYLIVLSPIIFLKIVMDMEQFTILVDWLPLINFLLIAFSVTSIVIPYLFANIILKWLESNPIVSRATPLQSLHLIGIYLSLIPSMAGFCLYLLGSSRNIIYYFVGISYAAFGTWWAWWHHRYSEAANIA